MDKLSKIYYNPKGYWKGISAIDRLAKEAGVSKEKAKEWLKNRLCGKFTYPLQDTFLEQNLV